MIAINNRLLTVLIILAVAIPNVSCAQDDPEAQMKIDALFQQWDHEQSPGAAIGIIQNGALIYARGYGSANLDYQIPLSPDSRFYIASIAKQFTAACIALLSIEGKLSLDDDIRLYFPDLPGYGSTITIRHLIHHTSGLRDYLSMMYLSGKSFEDYFNNEDGIALIARQKALNFPPDEEYLYSNSGYIMLAEIVHKVSGMPIREYADQHIFKPLKMNNTFFNDDHTQVTENRVISYRNVGDDTFKRFVQNFDGHGDGGMISTIHDLYLWDQNFYHKQVGGEEFVELMLSRRELNNGYLSTYSFGLEHGNYKGLDIVVHGGNFLGFNHHFTRFPDQQFSVIILSNVPEIDPYFMTDRISDIYLSEAYKMPPASDEIESTPITPLNLSSDILERYSGSYWNHKESFSRSVYVRNDTLRFDRGMNNVSALIPIGPDKFKMLVGGNVTVTFDGGDQEARLMTVNINEDSFFEFAQYEPDPYDTKGLAEFSGSYYSEELDCVYELKMKDGDLVLFIENKEISTLGPIMENMFMSNLAGIIAFNEENDSEFVVTNNRVRGVIFSKIR